MVVTDDAASATSSTLDMTDISVIGLGVMGSALAAALVAKGRR